MKKDTICALCTHPGKSALSVIRVSGPKALEIVKKQAPFLPDKLQSHHSYVGVLKQDNQDIDQVIATFFEEGKSFTGEQSLEISCHGGLSSNEILKRLLKDGARLAERGEFSFQSFCNGKMDLIQAEALLGVIESKNENLRKHSFKQLKGDLSKQLKDIEDQWMLILSHLEADIDFSMEDLKVITDEQLKSQLQDLKSKISQITNRYQPAEKLEQGLSCGLFGPVNSGKSSLFNALLKQEKAIVSSEEGTTRDIVESILHNENGINLHLKDTAGFRPTNSVGESLGQQKSKQLLKECDIQIFVIDYLSDFKHINSLTPNKDSKSILVLTKTDLDSNRADRKKLIEKIRTTNKNLKNITNENIFFVSSVTGEGIENLKNTLLSFLNEQESEDFVITNYRHYKGLKNMEQSLEQSLEILETGLGEKDLMALELRQGILFLYEILGKQIDDKVLDNIFKQFCIGK